MNAIAPTPPRPNPIFKKWHDYTRGFPLASIKHVFVLPFLTRPRWRKMFENTNQEQQFSPGTNYETVVSCRETDSLVWKRNDYKHRKMFVLDWWMWVLIKKKNWHSYKLEEEFLEITGFFNFQGLIGLWPITKCKNSDHFWSKSLWFKRCWVNNHVYVSIIFIKLLIEIGI